MFISCDYLIFTAVVVALRICSAILFVFPHSLFTRDVTSLAPGQCSVKWESEFGAQRKPRRRIIYLPPVATTMSPPRHHAARWSAIFPTLSIPRRHLHDAPRRFKDNTAHASKVHCTSSPRYYYHTPGGGDSTLLWTSPAACTFPSSNSRRTRRR